jgi:hypothetical protein
MYSCIYLKEMIKRREKDSPGHLPTVLCSRSKDRPWGIFQLQLIVGGVVPTFTTIR